MGDAPCYYTGSLSVPLKVYCVVLVHISAWPTINNALQEEVTIGKKPLSRNPRSTAGFILLQDVPPHKRSDASLCTSPGAHRCGMRKESPSCEIASSRDELIVWPRAPLVRGRISFMS